MKKITPEEAKVKIMHYCAYQERSHKQVKNKLYDWGLYSSDVNELISYLITEGYVSEERFAKSFVGGKFRMKKWGRLKIIRELESHQLTSNCIRIGLKEIDETDYDKTLKEIIFKKSGQISESNSFIKKNRIARYAIQKGFEPDLVWAVIKELFVD